ncbi:SRPBCC family protein [Paenibacillus alginolyticus]|uniref:SRPBCC domain-containing protein n=1 Tax=Paenibacillus alginolyticus TaxID=59839 RepID=A0ABT4GMH5_9BACL|nr:SRPBCC domain-containing protein [Paenibacillus alginolyticus]MCY9697410.1 SRPBCC domain-containing protein [Paenibacillus alginolyticus]MEC0141889.1 SRPBCC domain-containing protein [Paenibacillus alginolyticus]
MNQLNQTSDTIRKEMFIDCRPEILFSFFTDPEKMVRWMGRHILLEPSIGGKYRIDVNGSDIAMGEYKEIIPNEKIVMTWGWEKSKVVPPGSSTLEFTFTAKDKGTVLLLTHYDLPVEEVASHTESWMHYTTRLQTLAEGGDPGIDPWSVKAMH